MQSWFSRFFSLSLSKWKRKLKIRSLKISYIKEKHNQTKSIKIRVMKTNTKLRRELIEVCTAGTFQKTSCMELVSKSKSVQRIIHHSMPKTLSEHLDHYG